MLQWITITLLLNSLTHPLNILPYLNFLSKNRHDIVRYIMIHVCVMSTNNVMMSIVTWKSARESTFTLATPECACPILITTGNLGAVTCDNDTGRYVIIVITELNRRLARSLEDVYLLHSYSHCLKMYPCINVEHRFSLAVCDYKSHLNTKRNLK